jgi:hypothetical protein
MTIFSFGYNNQNVSIERVSELVTAGALLIDIRLKPFSRKATWNRTNLAKKFGESYLWAEGAGNRNYKGGPILLANPEPEYERLCKLLSAGKDLIIMCCCESHERCHRRCVIEELVRQTGAKVKYLVGASSALKRQNSGLFEISDADGKVIYSPPANVDDWMDDYV